MKRQYRGFRLLQTAGELRTAMHAPGSPTEKREHLVVPVVALVEGVIHPINAETPELVLERELAEVAAAWNGEPVVWTHPFVEGEGDAIERVSANDPDVLEKFAIGVLFNAKVRDKKLHLEAWIDKQRALEMGGTAAELVARIEAGDMIEVSVGAFVITEEREGTHNGVTFAAVWREIYPDHLALLPAGDIGACSNEMGCGAPRTAASLHTLTADGSLCAPTDADEATSNGGDEPGMLTKLLERVRALGNLRSGQDGKSDNDVRAILGTALFDTEPAFLGVTEVFPDDGEVIYETGVDNDFKLFKRTYSIAEDDTVTFGEAAEVRLEIETEFVPVDAAAGTECACGNPAACTCGTEPGDENMDRAAQVAALIAAEGNEFTDKDSDGLMAMSDAAISYLETADEGDAGEGDAGDGDAGDAGGDDAGDGDRKAAKDDDDAEGDDAGKAEPTEAQRREAWLADAPDDIRIEFEEMRAAKAERKAAIVTQLVAHEQDVYDKAALEAMSLADLENVAKMAQLEAIEPVDYSGLGTPRAATQKGEDQDSDIEPAPSLVTAIEKVRSAAA